MLGVDAEYFFYDGEVAVPAKDVLALHPKRKPVFKEIASDLRPEGYDSFQVELEDVLIIEDGLAFELPVEPSNQVEVIISRLTRGLREAWNLAENTGLSLSSTPLIYLDPRDLEDHPELRVLGCSPDMCVYEGLGEQKPRQNPRKTIWRTSGFHIHFSIKEIKHPANAVSLVEACDATIGLADVLFEHSPLGKQRRTMYGAAGKYRIQPHGVEYRTPSGAVSADPIYTRTILNLAAILHTAFEGNLFTGDDLMHHLGFKEVITAINGVDSGLAGELYPRALHFMESKGVPMHPTVYLPLETDIKSYSMEGWK